MFIENCVYAEVDIHRMFPPFPVSPYLWRYRSAHSLIHSLSMVGRKTPIQPPHPSVPLHTWPACPPLLPNPIETHNSYNLLPKYIPVRAPSGNNLYFLSNFPHAYGLSVDVDVVATQINYLWMYCMWYGIEPFSELYTYRLHSICRLLLYL